MEGKDHDSSKEQDGGCGSSISSHGTAVGGIILHPFHLFRLELMILGVLGSNSPSFMRVS